MTTEYQLNLVAVTPRSGGGKFTTTPPHDYSKDSRGSAIAVLGTLIAIVVVLCFILSLAYKRRRP
jgi:hypothetical protein